MNNKDNIMKKELTPQNLSKDIAKYLGKELTKEEIRNIQRSIYFDIKNYGSQCALGNVSGNKVALPTDECVEQWWAEGQDQKKGFWQEASYRTNDDVVEDIKKALKYFIETWQR